MARRSKLQLFLLSYTCFIHCSQSRRNLRHDVLHSSATDLCPQNVFYCEGLEYDTCTSICQLDIRGIANKFTWKNSTSKYTLKSKIQASLSSTLRLDVVLSYKSWPNIFLSTHGGESLHQIHLSILNEPHHLIEITMTAASADASLEFCTKLYGNSYCNSIELIPTTHDNAFESKFDSGRNYFDDTKKVSLIVKFDVVQCRVYLCASTHSIMETCFEQTKLHKIKNDNLYFEIGIVKSAAVNIDFESIYHIESNLYMSYKNDQTVFQNAIQSLSPVDKFAKVFKHRETEQCKRGSSNSAGRSGSARQTCRIIPHCGGEDHVKSSQQCQIQDGMPSSHGKTFIWSELTSTGTTDETLIDLNDVNVNLIRRVKIDLCRHCKNGKLVFLSKDRKNLPNILTISTVFNHKRLNYQFVASFNKRRIVFYHTYQSYKSISIILKFPTRNKMPEQFEPICQTDPILFLQKGESISMLGPVMINLNAWNGIKITGFDKINSIQIEKDEVQHQQQALLPTLMCKY